jgi:hypothetical protein
MSRSSKIQARIRLLIANFSHYVDSFVRKPPFTRFGQLEYHLDTIEARARLGSVINAVADDEFLRKLYLTLQAWGIGVRGSVLVSFEDFERILREKAQDIAAFEGLVIDDPSLDITGVSERLWRTIDKLGIVTNDARIVSGTKALHHLLPELVVPVDRAYTQRFFGLHNPEFQYNQAKFFSRSFRTFVEIARQTNPAQLVGIGWNSSRTKVIDNAIVGILCEGTNCE